MTALLRSAEGENKIRDNEMINSTNVSFDITDKQMKDTLIWGDLGSYSECDTAIDRIIGVMLSMVILFCHFKGAAGFPLSTLVMLMFLPVVVYKMLDKPLDHLASLIPLLIFTAYRILMHGTSPQKIVLSLMVAAYAAAAAHGVINIKAFIKSVCFVSCLNAFVIIFQTMMYYVFGRHISFIPSAVLTPDILYQVREAIATGIHDGIYRPSGFYNEPSHYIQFAIPCLMYLLLSPSKNRYKYYYALIISAGILCSTSGMGMAVTFALWGIVLFQNAFSSKSANRFVGIIIIALVALVIVIAYFAIPVFQESVLRIFGMSSNGTGAVHGRTAGGSDMIKSLSESEFIWGTGVFETKPGEYLSGMYMLIQSLGVVGLVLYWLIFVCCILVLKQEFRWFALVEGLLLIVAETYSLQYMLFNFLFMFAGCYILDLRQKQNENDEALDQAAGAERDLSAVNARKE